MDRKGQAGGLVGGIVAITVAAILVVNVFFPQIIGINTATWATGTSTLWNTLQIAGAIGMLVMTFRAFGVL